MNDQELDQDLPQWLRDGYQRFRAEDFAENRERDLRLATEGQEPKALWFGCSDSRVIPERILGAVSGDVFVVRNVANIVPPCDSASTSTGAAIEYAVQALGIEEIVVCGHEGCGGMQALMKGVDGEAMPNLAEWIKYSQAVCCEMGEASLEAIVKANVIKQLEHLRTYPCVADAERKGGLRLRAAYYELKSGLLQLFESTADRWTPIS